MIKYFTNLALFIFFFSTYLAATDKQNIVLSEEVSNLPLRYKITDLGTLGTDGSEAFAINEACQVLGTFKDKGTENLFLWTPGEGLYIVDLPILPQGWNLKLNNKGQISGNYFNSNYKCNRAFIWDKTNSFFDIGSLGGNETTMTAFNNNWQIIGTSRITENEQSHIFLWDQGKMIDLTVKFSQQVPGKWTQVWPVTINNYGDVIIGAYGNILTKNGNIDIWKTFVLKDNVFTMILPEVSSETSVWCHDYNDDRNMIVRISHENSTQELFIKSSNNSKTYLYENTYLLRNNYPIKIGELPGKIKKNNNGLPYFGPGIRIKKLLVEKEPFYRVADTSTRILDQNSAGYVVGRMDTIYPAYHAFLAIPENQIIKGSDND